MVSPSLSSSHLSHSSHFDVLYMHIQNPILIPTTSNTNLPLVHLVLSHHSSYSLLIDTFFLSFPKAMNKFKKSQVLVLCVLVVLLVITPSLPSSLRPTYLYFIINFLIMALCAEAGLLSVFSRPLEDKKQPVSVMPSEAISEKRERSISTPIVSGAVSEHAEKSASERVVCATEVDMVQNGPSMPSLFIIGGGEADEEVMDEELEAEEEIGGVNGQELFAKAEAFIGNFYKQLKMQK